MSNAQKALVSLTLLLVLAGCYSPPRLKDRLTYKSPKIQAYIEKIKKEYNVKELDNKVRYVEFPKEKPTNSIIILNDLDGSFKWYEELARELNRDYAVYILDRRSSGLNCDKHGSATDLVNDIDKLAEEIEKENPGTRINLFASCYGARRGLEFLLKNPEKLKTVTLSSPALEMDRKIDLNFLEKLGIAFSWIYGGTTRSAIPNDNLYTDNKENLELIQNDLLRIRKVSNNDYFWGHLQLWWVLDHLKKLEKTGIPIEIILGEKDKVVNIEKVEKIFRKKRNVKIEKLPTEHLIYFDKENKEVFIEEIREFINSHSQ